MYCNWGNKEVELTITQDVTGETIKDCDYPLCVRRHDNECLCTKT